MKSSLFSGLAASFMVCGAYGAAYSTNFNSLLFEGDVDGQDGWTVSDTTDQYSQVAEANVNRLLPLDASLVLQLGDAKAVTTPPPGPSVALAHAYEGTVGQTNVAFDFVLLDSRTTAANFRYRDTFGISISNAGSNIFSIGFVPDAQSETPSTDLAQWNLVYQLGNATTVDLNMAVFEGSQYNFNLAFNPNIGNPALTDFLLTIKSDVTPGGITDGVTNGLRNSGGAIPSFSLASSAATDEFNVFWAKEATNPGYGSNSILMDNLSVVPEPSSSLLLCLAGLGLACRRKRA